jgi:hypothetical protein
LKKVLWFLAGLGMLLCVYLSYAIGTTFFPAVEHIEKYLGAPIPASAQAVQAEYHPRILQSGTSFYLKFSLPTANLAAWLSQICHETLVPLSQNYPHISTYSDTGPDGWLPSTTHISAGARCLSNVVADIEIFVSEADPISWVYINGSQN